MRYKVTSPIRKFASVGDIIDLPEHEAKAFLEARVIIPEGEKIEKPVETIADEEAQFAPLNTAARKRVSKKKAGKKKKK